MPPWKPYDLSAVGPTVDNLHWFLEKCFDANQQNFRDQFFKANATEDQVRTLLANNKIDIPATTKINGNDVPVRLMLVDVEYARTWHEKNKPINPTQDLFYLLVMPPVPRNSDKAMQNWESAWYHAIVDGYGM